MLEVQGDLMFLLIFPQSVVDWRCKPGRRHVNGPQTGHNDETQAAVDSSPVPRFCQQWHDATALTATLTERKQWRTNTCHWVHPISQRMQESSVFSHLCPDFSHAKKKIPKKKIHEFFSKLNLHHQIIITFISHLLHCIFQYLLDNVQVAVHCVFYIAQECFILH